MSAKKTGKEIVAVVSAMGALLAIVVDLVGYLREFGADIGECIYRMAQANGKDTLKTVAKTITDGWRMDRAIAATSLSELVALGNYDRVEPEDSPDKFSVDKPVDSCEETRLFHFGRDIHFNEIVEEMDTAGWKPATIWHLLILSIKNPELQKQCPIVAFGSGRGWSPCIDSYDFDKRVLSQRDAGFKFAWHYRFLAVRK